MIESGGVGPWVGLAVAIGLALAFVSLLLAIRGGDVGLSRGQVIRLIAQLWLAVLGATGALVAVRVIAGGPLWDYSVGGGLALSELAPQQWVVLVGGVLIAGGCLLWARRLTAVLQRQGASDLWRPPTNEPAASDESDE
jgi:hypothetical protein